MSRDLWPDGTFVDFDHGLNVAVNRLRERLGDSAENPRFVETVPGVGYRFIAPVEAEPDPKGLVPTPPAVDAAAPLPRKRYSSFLIWVPLAACLVAFAAVTWVARDRVGVQKVAGAKSRIDSVAVLPLTDLSAKEGDDYFAEGITEELITELARGNSIRIISRTSIMQFKNKLPLAPEIGRRLNVDALVEGTIRRSGDRLRINVKLVCVSPERLIWAETYEGDMHDVLALERDVARDIAGNIHTKLSEDQVTDLRGGQHVDPGAYDDYLHGRYFLARRNTEAMKEAARYFQRAIQQDPHYAQAYASLALTYILLGTYEILPPEQSYPAAREFANKALELDGSLSEAYSARNC